MHTVITFTRKHQSRVHSVVARFQRHPPFSHVGCYAEAAEHIVSNEDAKDGATCKLSGTSKCLHKKSMTDLKKCH